MTRGLLATETHSPVPTNSIMNYIAMYWPIDSLDLMFKCCYVVIGKDAEPRLPLGKLSSGYSFYPKVTGA